MTALLAFPNPVDEVSARLVATGVFVGAVLAIALHSPALVMVLWLGFLLRVASGPRFSPLALLVTRVIRPRLAIAPRPVPGTPKRFAQGMGATFTSAVVLLLAIGASTAAWALLGILATFAALEAFAGFCMGCTVYGWLARVGLVEECPDCNDIGTRTS